MPKAQRCIHCTHIRSAHKVQDPRYATTRRVWDGLCRIIIDKIDGEYIRCRCPGYEYRGE